VAEADVNCAGVLKPGGVESAIVVVPPAFGSNCVVALTESPLKLTGEEVIVPTVVFELVTATFAVSPARTGWRST
jgi:hypothetical protein